MADNIVANAGTGGATLATDDIGGVHYPRTKVAWGGDGTATDVDTGTPLPVTGAVTVSGVATGAKQDTGNTTLASVDTKLPALGQALAAASVPVVLTAAQITTLTPPAALTGFATSGKQDTGNTSLSSIDGKLPSLGQALAAASVPVILPSATVTTLTPPAAITGFATSSKQDTAQTSLTSIDGKLPALGQALAAAAVPVVLTAAQVTTLTPPAALTTLPVTNAGTFAAQVTTINSVAPAFGTGARAATVQRVTIATDDVVPASQSGTWTVQPGNTANTTAWKVDGSAVTQPVSMATNTPLGTVAHDGVDSGAPMKVGAKAIASLKTTTLVSGADRTDNQSDLDGTVLVRVQCPLGDIVSERVSNTDGASTAFTNSAAVASTKFYVTAMSAFRTDTGTTMAYVDFRDGTAGTVKWTLPLPAGSGSIAPQGALPYFATTANTALAFDVSSALTTVYISYSGFYSKV